MFLNCENKKKIDARYEIKNGGFRVSLIDWTVKPYCDDYFHLENRESFKPNDRKRVTKILRCMCE